MFTLGKALPRKHKESDTFHCIQKKNGIICVVNKQIEIYITFDKRKANFPTL